jgi:hypothetical protein
MISSSPDRYTFSINNYLKRKEEEGKTLENNAEVAAMVQFLETEQERDQRKMNDPEWKKNNLEYDLRSTEWIVNKVRDSDSYAQNLYAAMCNNDFQKLDVIEVLKDNKWSCSWRYAGGIVAHMRGQGDYIEWYCSGIRGGMNFDDTDDIDRDKNYVGEGCITEEIKQDLQKLGWIPAPGGDWENDDWEIK